MEKIERLINLTAYLLDRERPVALSELKETVYRDQSSGDVALRRMFERDKEELRDMGIEVRTVPLEPEGETGYTISKDEYYLPHLDLAPEERVALNMVSRLFLGSGTPFSVHAHSALMKLAFEEEGRVEKVPHIQWVGTPRERETLSEIIDGLTRRKLLFFSYRALDVSEPVEREVEPYGLFNRHGHWYLVGICHLRGETRCFKLDRIVSGIRVNTSNPRTPDFEVPEDFDLREETRWEWPPPRGEEDVVARVRFSPRLSFIHSQARSPIVSEKRDGVGGLEVTYEIADPEQFVDWVLELGTDAQVLSPPELREMIADRLDGLLSGLEEK